MDKLIQALIAELKVSLAGQDQSAITGVEEKLKALPTDEKESQKAKEECLHTLANLSVDKAVPNSNSFLLQSIAKIYDLFSSAMEYEKIEDESVREAHAELYGILSTLMMCSDDLERAVKALKEMVLLIEIEGDKSDESQASEDDDKVATAEKAMKTEGGKQYPATAYLYVPDTKKPSTWKLRIWETPDTKVTMKQLGRAVAAIGKGFRGQKVSGIPSGEMAKIKSKIHSLYKKAGVKEEDIPEILKGKSSKGSEYMTELVKEPQTEEIKVAESKVETPKVEDVKKEEPKVEVPVASNAKEVEELKTQVATLTQKIAAYEAKEIAMLRMKELKDKGVAVIFATDESQNEEIKKLMAMNDTQYAEHLSLLELAKAAFSPKEEPKKEEIAKEEPKKEAEAKTEEPQIPEVTPTVAVAEKVNENDLSRIRAIWDV